VLDDLARDHDVEGSARARDSSSIWRDEIAKLAGLRRTGRAVPYFEGFGGLAK
jgi:hypothetical protein